VDIPKASDNESGVGSAPPRGWNTWDCYGSLVTEAEVKANAEAMAEKLLPYGWDHVVIDIRWYEPKATLYEPLTDGGARDEFGRYLPAPNRFPSSSGGKGFRPLAGFLHERGLKLGLHMIRGIPQGAVRQHQPIEGTSYTADQIADITDDSMRSNFGIDTARPGAQEYYDSVIRLYASWGIDFIKADDMVKGGEIELLVRALEKYGPDIGLSLVSVSRGGILRHKRACMFRIGHDVWDEWHNPDTWWMGLRDAFATCAAFAPHIGRGSYPDADMLPLGRLGKNDAEGHGERWTGLTRDEQVTLMTLWSIFRSPLMFGGSLVELDDFTLSLLTNPEVLAVNERSRRNRPLYMHKDRVAWGAEATDSLTRYAALFNTADSRREVTVNLSELGLGGRARVRDLWRREDLGRSEVTLHTHIDAHASRLLSFTAEA
jgi:alpha-galactosidase